MYSITVYDNPKEFIDYLVETNNSVTLHEDGFCLSIDRRDVEVEFSTNKFLELLGELVGVDLSVEKKRNKGIY